jgi:hypothetical protein
LTSYIFKVNLPKTPSVKEVIQKEVKGSVPGIHPRKEEKATNEKG